MKKPRLPRGWTQKRIRELAAYHDNQTEEEQAAEIEAALAKENTTLMVVPTELVPKIARLIAKCEGQDARGPGEGAAEQVKGRVKTLAAGLRSK